MRPLHHESRELDPGKSVVCDGPQTRRISQAINQKLPGYQCGYWNRLTRWGSWAPNLGVFGVELQHETKICTPLLELIVPLCCLKWLSRARIPWAWNMNFGVVDAPSPSKAPTRAFETNKDNCLSIYINEPKQSNAQGCHIAIVLHKA